MEEMTLYTWDELYDMAIGAACGSYPLTAKDEARWQLCNKVKEISRIDLEADECPEDAIDDWIKANPDSFPLFDKSGNLIALVNTNRLDKEQLSDITNGPGKIQGYIATCRNLLSEGCTSTAGKYLKKLYDFYKYDGDNGIAEAVNKTLLSKALENFTEDEINRMSEYIEEE